MKPGDIVELINISDLGCEDHNWILFTKPNAKIGEIFIVEGVHYNGRFITLEGHPYLHHTDRFKLVQ